MAKKNVRTRVKRSERKNIANGQAHIKSTFNNTIVSITDPQGNVISWQSAGTVGFKGSRKSTPFAAQMAAEAAAKTAQEHGLRKVAVFVNGCYWHRCPHCALPMPKSNVAFWSDKFARNRARDERNHRALVEDGWTVLVVWECRLKGARLDRTVEELAAEVARAGSGGTARLREVGATDPWKLAVRRKRLHGRR